MKHPDQIMSEPDPDFPLDEFQPPLSKLPTFKLSYRILREAVQKVHDKVSNGAWGMKIAQEHMKVHCLNLESQNGILECAGNCAAWQKSLELPHNDAFAVACREEKESNPARSV